MQSRTFALALVASCLLCALYGCTTTDGREAVISRQGTQPDPGSIRSAVGTTFRIPSGVLEWKVVDNDPHSFGARWRIADHHTAAVQIFRVYPAGGHLRLPDDVNVIERYLQAVLPDEVLIRTNTSLGTGELATCVQYVRHSTIRRPSYDLDLLFVKSGLACRHPTAPNLYLEIVYSERGPTRSLDLSEASIRASSFLQSVGFARPSAATVLEEIGLVGVEFSQDKLAADGAMAVVSVLPGLDAQRQGIRAGDLLLSVDGVDIAGLSVQEVQTRLVGKSGTTVNIRLARPGTGDPLVFTVTRLPPRLRLY